MAFQSAYFELNVVVQPGHATQFRAVLRSSLDRTRGAPEKEGMYIGSTIRELRGDAVRSARSTH